MVDAYLIGVAIQAIKNSNTDTFYNKEVTKRLKMDDIKTYESLPVELKYDCNNDPSEVEIELLRRDVHCAWTFNYWHWAWFVRFKNGPRYKYAIIEFLETGIRVLLFAWGQEISEKNACFSIVGDENRIEWDQQFKTSLNWGQILKIIYNLSCSYTSKSFSRTSKNCKDFATEFGEKVSYNFKKSDINFNKSCSI